MPRIRNEATTDISGSMRTEAKAAMPNCIHLFQIRTGLDKGNMGKQCYRNEKKWFTLAFQKFINKDLVTTN